MINLNWEANLTVSDREDGDRYVTITQLSFEIPETESDTD